MTCSIREGTPGLDKVGLLENHSFSLVSAFERKVNGQNLRLMKLRNPFGMGEWTGDWSDKSSKWDDNAKKAFPEFDDYGEYQDRLDSEVTVFSGYTSGMKLAIIMNLNIIVLWINLI